MHIPKNYFHDRLVLLLISFSTFLTIFTSLLILFRLRNDSNEGLISQYHSNLGLSAFEPGTSATYFSFIIFGIFVLVFHTMLSMKMYHRRRDYSTTILWMALFLQILLLIVSNALSVL